MNLNIIYEDKHVIVLHKPPGLATQTKKVGEQDLYNMVKNYLSGGYVGIINRLDQQVDGIVLMAKNSSSAARLTEQMVERKIEKNYRARVYIRANDTSVISDSYVRLTDYVIVDRDTNLSRISNKTVTGSKLAELEYKLVELILPDENDADYMIGILDILLHTGRHHQIRLQLSNAGIPILGDLKYGSEESIAYSKKEGIEAIELTAYRLKFIHPSKNVEMTFTI